MGGCHGFRFERARKCDPSRGRKRAKSVCPCPCALTHPIPASSSLAIHFLFGSSGQRSRLSCPLEIPCGLIGDDARHLDSPDLLILPLPPGVVEDTVIPPAFFQRFSCSPLPPYASALLPCKTPAARANRPLAFIILYSPSRRPLLEHLQLLFCSRTPPIPRTHTPTPQTCSLQSPSHPYAPG